MPAPKFDAGGAAAELLELPAPLLAAALALEPETTLVLVTALALLVVAEAEADLVPVMVTKRPEEEVTAEVCAEEEEALLVSGGGRRPVRLVVAMGVEVMGMMGPGMLRLVVRRVRLKESCRCGELTCGGCGATAMVVAW